MTSQWYLAPKTLPNDLDPAASAFEEGLQIFKTRLTADPKKRAHTLKAAKLEDVLDEVYDAQSRYEAKKFDSKTRKCIIAFSKRVHFYGKVLDVMVQHHPEYASLAWGAIKLVFGSIIEHEKIGVTIVSALCDVVDALAQVELVEMLYPTPMMKQTITLLYAHIIKFLLRASAWYETTTISRALQSITRPAALRYADLIQDIQKDTGKVSNLSIAGSQAEQREMHDKLREVHEQQTDHRTQSQTRMQEMQRQIEYLTALVQQTNQGQKSSENMLALHIRRQLVVNDNISKSQVDIQLKLSDVQLTQALTFVSATCQVDHKASYQYALLARQRRKFSSQTKCSPFWTSPLLKTWDTDPSSSLITLKATYRDRLNIRDFCTNVIEQLLECRVVILWIMASQGPSHTIFDILKSLIYQTLMLDHTSHTDTVMSFHLRKYQVAHSVQDYVNILGDLLGRFDRVYISIDTDAVSIESVDECRQLLKTLSRTLEDRGAKTVVKILLVDCRPGGSRKP